LQFSYGNFESVVQEIDDHEIHINEHIAFLLGTEGEKLKEKGTYNKVLEHIKMHKKFAKMQNEINDIQNV